MRPYASVGWIVATGVAALMLLVGHASAEDARADLSGDRVMLLTPDPSGLLSTVSTHGAALGRSNPFFRSLGTNGRACVTCHAPSQAWSISPPEVRRRYEESNGTDPLFRTNDGAIAPTADVSTRSARREAYQHCSPRA